MASDKKINRRFTIAWVLWIVAFLVIEGLALFNTTGGDTLSEHVWVLVAIPIGFVAVAAFMLWLTYHFLFDGKRLRPHWFKKGPDNEV